MLSRNIFQAKTSVYAASAGFEEINIQEMQTMQKTSFRKSLSLIVCTVLIAAMALITTGCNANNTNDLGSNASVTSAVSLNESNILGQGATQFIFSVTDVDGNEAAYQINTDKTTVGEALEELGLIAGEKSEYGLYIKTVNGITVDFDTDGKYWAFYVDGEYAMAGADTTEIEADSTYSFKVE